MSDQEQHRVAKFMMFVVIPILLVIIILLYLQPADAQISVKSEIDKFDEEGLTNCEVMQVSEFFYFPAVLEFEYPQTENRDIKIVSNDPESDVDVSHSPVRALIRINSPDNHILTIKLGYTETLRNENIMYRFVTSDSILTEEGNWRFSGSAFCKLLSFRTTEAPAFPTPEETANAVQKTIVTNLDEIQTDHESNEFVFGFGTLIQLAFSVMVGVFALVVMFKIYDIKRIPDKALKKLDKANEKLTNSNQNMKNVVQMQKVQMDFQQSKFQIAMEDLVVVANSMGKKVELKSAFPKPETMIPKPEVGKLTIMKETLQSKITTKQDKLPESQKEWIEHYLKKPRKENDERYAELQKEWDKTKNPNLLDEMNGLLSAMLKQT